MTITQGAIEDDTETDVDDLNSSVGRGRIHSLTDSEHEQETDVDNEPHRDEVQSSYLTTPQDTPIPDASEDVSDAMALISQSKSLPIKPTSQLDTTAQSKKVWRRV